MYITEDHKNVNIDHINFVREICEKKEFLFVKIPRIKIFFYYYQSPIFIEFK